MRDKLDEYRWTFEPLSADDPFWLEVNEDKAIFYKRVLNDLEHFAVGVNMGTYDLPTIDRLSGGHIIRVYANGRLAIFDARTRNSRAYVELEELALRLAKRRNVSLAPLASEPNPPSET